MDPSITSNLLDFGALGLFAAYLIYSNVKTQKRLDEMVSQFLSTTETQEKAHAAAEDLIRTRYDAIIARHESQRQSVYNDVVKKLDDHTRTLISIESLLSARSQVDPMATRPDF